MKTIIFVAIVFTALLAAGCRPTLNVTETNEKQIEENLIKFQKEEAIGAEVTLSLKFGEEISGELLSVRDSTITVCTEYSATEKELASLKYPINIVKTDNILELKIEGTTYPILIGAGIGAVAGVGVGVLVGTNYESETSGSPGTEACIGIFLGTLAGSAVFLLGAGIGAIFSTEEVILTEIPPGYKLVPLKTLARYPDEEPEYLRAIP